jgi:hypothetical protein
MDRKRKICRLIEKHVNKKNSEVIKEAYGENSSIKIHNLTYSITNPSILVEAVIILGNEINESIMDREIADYLIQETLPYFFSDIPSKVMIRWDVI